MYVCMYVCVYVCVCVCMYIYMCAMSFCHRSTHYVEPRNSPAVCRVKDRAVNKSTVWTLHGGSGARGWRG